MPRPDEPRDLRHICRPVHPLPARRRRAGQPVPGRGQPRVGVAVQPRGTRRAGVCLTPEPPPCPAYYTPAGGVCTPAGGVCAPSLQPWVLGSGPRYMICVTLFCTLRESKTHGHARFARISRAILACPKSVRISHVREFLDSCNMQKRATKSDTSGHCLLSAHRVLRKPGGGRGCPDVAVVQADPRRVSGGLLLDDGAVGLDTAGPGAEEQRVQHHRQHLHAPTGPGRGAVGAHPLPGGAPGASRRRLQPTEPRAVGPSSPKPWHGSPAPRSARWRRDCRST